MANLSIFRLCFCSVETNRRVIEVDDLMLISQGPQEVQILLCPRCWHQGGEDTPPKKSSRPPALGGENWRES